MMLMAIGTATDFGVNETESHRAPNSEPMVTAKIKPSLIQSEP
jgi:hypothetical protein